jgi:cellulose synthase/poly-beta-1,6-N-acetylglucosamine synthase-like glycosyltransferase
LLPKAEEFNLLSFVNVFNRILFIVLTSVYFYQLVYVIVTLISGHKKRTPQAAANFHRYAAIIAARNEEAVIGELIQSIKNQSYPSELLDIFVVADNCTDRTADVARAAGAIVHERTNRRLVGKGYALNFIFNIIDFLYSDKNYEGYFVFDADNLLDEHFVAEMNNVFDRGYRVITSYRNSKNYGSNWISAGYALWFLREATYLNNPRMMLNTSCAISGTGFLVSSEIIRKNGGWKHYLLTEDIEFSVDQIIQGEIIGYCADAKIYDEQPCTFEQSWNQRLRWAKGFYQVFQKYGGMLISSVFSKKQHRFSSYDILMTIMPSMLLFLVGIFVNSGLFLLGMFSLKYGLRIMIATSTAVGWSILSYYLTLFALGLLTTITEWKEISCPNSKKIRYLFTFPVFILTYIPISIVALFKNVEWKPIIHSFSISMEEVRRQPTRYGKG